MIENSLVKSIWNVTDCSLGRASHCVPTGSLTESVQKHLHGKLYEKCALKQYFTIYTRSFVLRKPFQGEIVLKSVLYGAVVSFLEFFCCFDTSGLGMQGQGRNKFQWVREVGTRGLGRLCRAPHKQPECRAEYGDGVGQVVTSAFQDSGTAVPIPQWHRTTKSELALQPHDIRVYTAG